MRWWRFLVPLALFLVLAAFLAVGLDRNPREVPSPLIGKPAPEFSVPTLQDPQRSVSLADTKGRVWMLNVWASWCVPCREEHPLIVAYAKTQRVAVIGLNYKDTRAAATRWLQSLGNPYEASMFDETGRLGLDFGVYGVPETFIIDKQGIVRFKHVGPLNADVIKLKIDPLVKALNG